MCALVDLVLICHLYIIQVRRLLCILKHPYNESVDLSACSPDPPSKAAETEPIADTTSVHKGSAVDEREEKEVDESSSASGLQRHQDGHQALLQHYCSRPPMSAVGIVVT